MCLLLGPHLVFRAPPARCQHRPFPSEVTWGSERLGHLLKVTASAIGICGSKYRSVFPAHYWQAPGGPFLALVTFSKPFYISYYGLWDPSLPTWLVLFQTAPTFSNLWVSGRPMGPDRGIKHGLSMSPGSSLEEESMPGLLWPGGSEPGQKENGGLGSKPVHASCWLCDTGQPAEAPVFPSGKRPSWWHLSPRLL